MTYPNDTLNDGQSKRDRQPNAVAANELSQKDNRRFKRAELSCPVKLSQWPEREPYTENISDGGCLMIIANHQEVSPGVELNLELSIPRQTPNSQMWERQKTSAQVVRVETYPKGQAGAVGVALQFVKPLDLQLD